MVVGLTALLLAPALVAATSIEYYRSAFCDARGAGFLLERSGPSESLLNEKACHQAPARTMGMKLIDGIDPACVVLAYDDYGCTSFVGSIPSSGKCVAATKAKIGSWRVQCNATDEGSVVPTSVPYLPGELKRRNKMRISSDEQGHNVTATPYTSATSTSATVVASLIASEISSAVNASATNDAAALVTSSPSAGAALSSAISSGTGIDYNLTTYVTAGLNSSYTTPCPKTSPTSFSTVTYTGTRGSNGTAVLHTGGSSSSQIDSTSVMVTLLCGVLALVGAIAL